MFPDALSACSLAPAGLGESAASMCIYPIHPSDNARTPKTNNARKEAENQPSLSQLRQRLQNFHHGPDSSSS